MIIHKLNPQGFCKGVINAIKLAKAAVNDSSIKKLNDALTKLIQ